MSSSASCWLDELFVGSTGDVIDPVLIALFVPPTKSFRRVDSPRLPSQLQHYSEDAEGDEDLRVVYYEAPIEVIKDRLHILGYTLDTSKKAFQARIAAEIRYQTMLMEEYAARDENTRKMMTDHYRNEIEALSIVPRIVA